MRNMLIIVDAWENPPENPEINDDELLQVKEEIHALGYFINMVCKRERQRGTKIVFTNTNREILNHIDTRDSLIVDHLINQRFIDFLNNEPEYDNFYIGGFHYNYCILQEYQYLLHNIGGKNNKIQIVLNLCLPFTNKPWYINHNIHYRNIHCLWSNLRFETLELGI